MKNDPVIERSLDQRVGLEPDAVEFRAHIAQGFHLHLEAEGHLERTFARSRTLQFHFVRVLVHPHENLRERDVLLGVEIGREILEGEHVIADQDALPGIDPAKAAAGQRPAADGDGLRAVILEQDQIVITKGEQPIGSGQALDRDVGRAIRPEGNRLERGSAALVDLLVGILRGVQLINDIDRLRRHPELRHERVERDDLVLLQAGLGNQIVELHPEHDLAIRAERGRELLRHGGEILLLVERLPEKHPQLRINRFRIIVTQEAEAGVDLFLEQNAVRFGETGQHLDEEREQVRALRDTARFAHRAPHPAPAPAPPAVGERRDELHRPVDFIRKTRHRFGHS